MPITFDKKAGRFRDASGRFVGENFVRGSIERATIVLQNDLRRTAKDVNAGRINLAEFQKQLAEQIKTAHVFTASVGKGGRRQMSPSDWGAVGAEIRGQYKFLNRFAGEIEAGTPASEAAYGGLLTLWGADKRADIDRRARAEAKTSN